MNWEYLFQATAQSDAPVPGWLFKEICLDAQNFSQEVPEVAEYLMRCVSSKHRDVSMKACLCIHHLAVEVKSFQRYLRRCPAALELLATAAEPPELEQARQLELPEVKIARDSAARALRSLLQQGDFQQERRAAEVKAKCQGFGNYMPPQEKDKSAEGGGIIDQVTGFVGDAVGDTIDDFREKGAVGAVRDGMLDAADLISDGIGSIWGFLGGRKVREGQARQAQQTEQRICVPVAEDVLPRIRVPTQAPEPVSATYAAAAAAGGYASRAGGVVQTPVAAVQEPVHAVASAPAAPVAAPPPDLLSFDDCPSPRSTGEEPQSQTSSMSRALELKNQGNDLVRSKKHQEAVSVYEAAVESIAAEDLQAEARALATSLHANLALCYLQLQLYRRAVDAASESLKLDATYAKAYYRRCLAYRALKMYTEAKQDLDALHFCRHELSPAEMKRLQDSVAAGLAPG